MTSSSNRFTRRKSTTALGAFVCVCFVFFFRRFNFKLVARDSNNFSLFSGWQIGEFDVVCPCFVLLI